MGSTCKINIMMPNNYCLLFSFKPRQMTPASSLWRHSLTAVKSALHWVRCISLLSHRTLDMWIGPCPSPKYALLVGIAAFDYKWHTNYHQFNTQLNVLPWVISSNPSCRHTTVASFMSHPSSQTVPHKPYKQISTLPLLSSEKPFTSLMLSSQVCWHILWFEPS